MPDRDTISFIISLQLGTAAGLIIGLLWVWFFIKMREIIREHNDEIEMQEGIRCHFAEWSWGVPKSLLPWGTVRIEPGPIEWISNDKKTHLREPGKT